MDRLASPEWRIGLAPVLLAAVLLLACGGSDLAPVVETQPDLSPAPRCAHRVPERQALFGDLHVHTSLSSDAWNFGVRLMPEDAYRYAFGQEIRLAPVDAEGNGTRPVRIDRPLDFAAVTDHAEFLGESVICADPEREGYSSDFCEVMRAGKGRDPKLLMKIMSPITWRDSETCGEEDARCVDAARGVWHRVIDAAETWNDESESCERTTFIGYEYSSHRLGSNLHRNVIFKNATVPRMPVSYLEAPREWELWAALQRDCIDAGTGCDALAIPHNSNISNGRMFAVDYPGASSLDAQRRRAALRARVEPLIEIMQHKGDSECRNGLSNVLGGEDELCDFEKFEDFAMESRDIDGDPCYSGAFADWLPHLGPDCLSPLSYARYALVAGLEEQRRLGVNPFRFGLSASTDTHNALPGGVDERSFPGHLGVSDARAIRRVKWDPEIAGNANNGPGGLIGVWAEENSRASIFAAMQRREVFGTSGPRIQPRLFAGWGIDDLSCDTPDWLTDAYERAVPMGADLPPAPTNDARPRFVVAAQRDVGSDRDGGLQRLQIVKGWADAEGRYHQQVIDVAGGANDASVDPSTCTPTGSGYDRLCARWTDPDFDRTVSAVYYARVVENPSCRFDTWQCLSLAAEERPVDCEAQPRLIQERAWTSPIWYTGVP
jgi:hypothetical protein